MKQLCFVDCRLPDDQCACRHNMIMKIHYFDSDEEIKSLKEAMDSTLSEIRKSFRCI